MKVPLTIASAVAFVQLSIPCLLVVQIVMKKANHKLASESKTSGFKLQNHINIFMPNVNSHNFSSL